MGAASGNCDIFYTVEFRLTEEGAWHTQERFDNHDDAVTAYKGMKKRSSSDIEVRLVRWAGSVVRPK